MTLPTQVLVVGSGPSGLTLALCLAFYGVSVRIVEKQSTHRVGRRGAGITPRTLEVYQTLGILQDVLQLAHAPVPFQSYELPGGTKVLRTWNMSETLNPTPACPYPNAVFLGQDQVEGILRQHLQRYSVEVELGTSLHSFIQTETGVEVVLGRNTDGQCTEEALKVDFLVGADGAKGVVRKMLKLDFLGETRLDEKLIVGDFRLTGVDTKHIHMWTKGAALTILVWPGQTESRDLFTMQIAGTDLDRAKAVSEPGYLAEFFHTATGREDVIFHETVWLSEYTPNIRMVDKLIEGRAVVAGDAAHVHSLVGGQGMNSSVQDSFNLGWKLAYIVNGWSSTDLLSTYNEERLPVIAEMLNKTTEIHKRTFKSTQRDDASHWQRNQSLSQLGVNYRWSSIVIDDERAPDPSNPYGADTMAIDLHAGDRAPNATELAPIFEEATPFALFDIFSYKYHTILIFSDRVSQIVAQLSAYIAELPSGSAKIAVILPPHAHASSIDIPDASWLLSDSRGYARDGYGIEAEAEKVIVIRPDGMIGAISRGLDGVQKYFKRLTLA